MLGANNMNSRSRLFVGGALRVAIFCALLPLGAQVACPTGYTPVLGDCFKVHTKKLALSDAIHFCEGDDPGSALASVTSHDHIVELISLLDLVYDTSGLCDRTGLVGLHKEQPTGTDWYWVRDNTSFVFSEGWDSSDPVDEAKQCACLSGYGEGLRRLACEEKRCLICQVSNEVTPTTNAEPTTTSTTTTTAEPTTSTSAEPITTSTTTTTAEPTTSPTAEPTTSTTAEPIPTSTTTTTAEPATTTAAEPTTITTAEPTTSTTTTTAEPTTTPTTGEPTTGTTAGPTTTTSVELTTGTTAGPTTGTTAGPTTGATAGPTTSATAEPTTGTTAGSSTGTTAGPISGTTAEPTTVTTAEPATLTAQLTTTSNTAFGRMFQKLAGAPTYARATSGVSVLTSTSATSVVGCAAFCLSNAPCNGFNLSTLDDSCEALSVSAVVTVSPDAGTLFFYAK